MRNFSDPYSERAGRLKPSAIRHMSRLASSAGGDLITFAGGMPNPLTFPLHELADIAASEITQHGGRNLQYGLTAGYRPLVEWIRAYVARKGIHARPDDIVCTTGSQQAIDLVTEVLIDPGDEIFVEVPTYVGALSVFYKSGAKIVPIRQDDGGIDLQDLEKKLAYTRNSRHKLIYLISNFQNPSGISLREERRKKLPDLLRKYDAYLIEDDPYGEIYFSEESKPPAPVKHFDQERVLYLGTFSKLIAPAFRTGWVIASGELARKIELAKEAADLCSSMLDQRIVYRFCSSPGFNDHLVSLRTFYRQRFTAMIDALARYMPEGVTWTRPAGGLFLWLTLPQGLDPETFLDECISQRKVSFVIGRAFICDDSGNNFLRLAFSVESPERIEEGVKRLARLIDEKKR
jgi:2-aminoadipate transaminase